MTLGVRFFGRASPFGHIFRIRLRLTVERA